jgi:hypothetical protein
MHSTLLFSTKKTHVLRILVYFHLQEFKVILHGALNLEDHGDKCLQNVRNHVPSNAASHLRSPPLHCCENVRDQHVLG